MGTVGFYPIDITTRTSNNRTSVVLYGRSASGEQISVIDSNYLPYIYLVPSGDTDALELELSKFTIKVKENYYSIIDIYKRFNNETLYYYTNPEETQKLRQILMENDIRVRAALEEQEKKNDPKYQELLRHHTKK